jgi:hypothetical protein
VIFFQPFWRRGRNDKRRRRNRGKAFALDLGGVVFVDFKRPNCVKNCGTRFLKNLRPGVMKEEAIRSAVSARRGAQRFCRGDLRAERKSVTTILCIND